MKFLIFSILFIFTLYEPSYAADFKIIVNDDFPVTSITKKDLRRMFMLRQQTINGQSISVINLEASNDVRIKFSAFVFNKLPDAMERYYIKSALSGRGAVRKSLFSEQEIIDFVKSKSGAIGYIALTNKSVGVRELLIKDE